MSDITQYQIYTRFFQDLYAGLYPVGGATGSYTQSGTGAVLRTVQDKLREGEVSTAEFVQLGDGSDYGLAIQRAVNTRRPVYIPPGNFTVSTPVVLTSSPIYVRGAGTQQTVLMGAAGIDVLSVVCPTGGGLPELEMGHFQINGGGRGIVIKDDALGGTPSYLSHSRFEHIDLLNLTAECLYAPVNMMLESSFSHIFTLGGTYGGRFLCPEAMNLVTFTDCVWHDATTVGLSFASGTATGTQGGIGAIILINNLFERNFKSGLEVTNNRFNVTLQGGWFEANGADNTNSPVILMNVANNTGIHRGILRFEGTTFVMGNGIVHPNYDGDVVLKTSTDYCGNTIIFDGCAFYNSVPTRIDVGTFTSVPAVRFRECNAQNGLRVDGNATTVVEPAITTPQGTPRILAADSAPGVLPVYSFASEPTLGFLRSQAGIMALNGALVVSTTVNAFSNVSCGLTAYFTWGSLRNRIGAPADGQMTMTNLAVSSGVGLDFLTDGVLKVRTRAPLADTATVDAKVFSSGGAAGVATFGPSAVTSITVKGGIITAIS